jgi:hypothetical protein
MRRMKDQCFGRKQSHPTVPHCIRPFPAPHSPAPSGPRGWDLVSQTPPDVTATVTSRRSGRDNGGAGAGGDCVCMTVSRLCVSVVRLIRPDVRAEIY